MKRGRNRDSVVTAVTRLKAGHPKNRGSIPHKGRFISSSKRADPLWGSLGLVFSGYWEFFLWSIKQPGCEVDHSPHSFAEVKNKYIYITFSWCGAELSKHYIVLSLPLLLVSTDPLLRSLRSRYFQTPLFYIFSHGARPCFTLIRNHSTVMFYILRRRREDKRTWSECNKNSTNLIFSLIYSWMSFWFASAVSNYCIFIILSSYFYTVSI